MQNELRVAIVQMNSQDDKVANIDVAMRGIERAAREGARLVSLPEVWTYLGPNEGNVGAAETIPGPLTDQLAATARELDIYLHAGSMYERVEGDDRLANTTVVFDPKGEIIGTYRKIHMFDVDLDEDTVYRESDTVAPGDEMVTVDVDGTRVGLAICYDLRFPELFRILTLWGADVIMLPAAFTLATGRDHWEPLIRARAIENQVFMVAAGQVGKHPPGHWCYGRSLIVDPWGVVMAQASDAPTVISATLDLTQLERVRRQVPSVANRMPSRYRWPEAAEVSQGTVT
ncbi:MAG: carbon-nitrogen hydrolase family protein [Chloroflexota bacterium]|nr:carbon-nitrogen hydrolase family protein [Chloroflexota bacterium]